MVINRNLWLQNTLNAFDSELCLRLQPDNISKLPKLDEIKFLVLSSNFRHGYGIFNLINSLSGPLNPQIISKTSLFKRPKVLNSNVSKKSIKTLLSVSIKLFPHHWSVHQLLPFVLFYFCYNNNRLFAKTKHALPNTITFKINNLNYFNCYRWYYDRGSVDWGCPINLSLESFHNIALFGPLFKFVKDEL